MGNCDYSEVQCKMCGQHVQKKTLATHQKTDCPMRPELCVHCGKDVPIQQMQVCQLVVGTCHVFCLEINSFPKQYHVPPMDEYSV